MRIWTSGILLLAACTAHHVRCDAHLQPINAPARVAAPPSEHGVAAARSGASATAPAQRVSP